MNRLLNTSQCVASGLSVLLICWVAPSPTHGGNDALLAFSSVQSSSSTFRRVGSTDHTRRSGKSHGFGGRRGLPNHEPTSFEGRRSNCLYFSSNEICNEVVRDGVHGRRRLRHNGVSRPLRMSTTSESGMQQQDVETKLDGDNGDSTSMAPETSSEEGEQEVLEAEGDSRDAMTEPGRVKLPNIVNPFKVAFDAGRQLRMTIATNLEQITGTPSPLEGVRIKNLEEYEKMLYSPFDTQEEVPTVLVVGATGEMGRVVVRKLLLRGFSVRVLVRNLYSSTLDLLGSGPAFAQGDLTNYRSIVDAVSGVDKKSLTNARQVIFCAQARDPFQVEKVEYEGLKNLVAAFQDQRVVLYGDPYSTKKALFRFNRQNDRDLWAVADDSRTTAMWKENKFGYGTFASSRMYDAGYATIESARIELNLGAFSGVAVRCCGDGKEYTFVIRDEAYESTGIQYEAPIRTKTNKWMTHRLSFSTFEPYKDGQRVIGEAGMELDRNNVRQFAVAYKRTPVDPFNFVLSMHFVKVYRTQIEPEFIYISSAGVPPITDANYDGVIEALRETNPKSYYSARGEELLRRSGLTYTIIRVEGFNNMPGGLQAIEVKQATLPGKWSQGLLDSLSKFPDPENVGLISRADAAEITVQCLLDPRACNLALYTSTSRYAPSASDPNQKMSSQLGRLRPNT